MSSQYFLAYSTAKNEIVSVKLNLSNYVTQKEFKNLTGDVDTSDFVLKTNLSELKDKADKIDINKINVIDKLQGKHFVESNYLYFNPNYENFKVDETNSHRFLSWKAIRVSNEKFKPPEDKNTPKLLFEKTGPYLKIESFKFLAQEKISYTHESIVNLCIAYLMPDITHTKGSDLIRYGLFGATSYDNKVWKGYGAAFGSQIYPREDGKDVGNLVILGVDSTDNNNELALGEGSIKVSGTTTIQAKSELLINWTKPNKNLCCLYTTMVVIVFCLLTIFNNINSRQKTLKLKQVN